MSNIRSRSFENEDDFWRIRQLIIETYPVTPTGFNREIRWWDGWRFHREDSQSIFEKRSQIQLWELSSQNLIGAAISESNEGDVCFLLHPDYRFLESDMLDWSEENLSRPVLSLGAWDYDIFRRRLLEKRGYIQQDQTYRVRHMRLGNQPLPEVEIAAGYRIRGTTSDDYTAMAELLNLSFNRTFHTSLEYQTFATHSPSFQHDLNLVVESPDGTLAAHVGVSFEENNGYGIFEPVCTHPAHRQKGLAKALMMEGLYRLKALGAQHVYVETWGAEAANALYDGVGFTEIYHGRYWDKKIKGT